MKDIPSDLYRIILCHLSPGDLFTACRVSQAFRDEARYLLYRNTDLSSLHLRPERLLSWANAVTSNATLAEITRSLRFPRRVGRARDRLFDFDILVKLLTAAFQAVVNLHSLELTSGSIVTVIHGHYLDFDKLFQTNPFHLRVFLLDGGIRNSHEEAAIYQWLSTQTDITEWRLDSAIFIHHHHHLFSLLPQLSAFDMVYLGSQSLPMLRFAASRPLARFRIRVAGECNSLQLEGLMHEIAALRQTLLHFQLAFEGYSPTVSPDEAIKAISRVLPQIKCLEYSHSVRLLIAVDDILVLTIACSLIQISLHEVPSTPRSHHYLVSPCLRIFGWIIASEVLSWKKPFCEMSSRLLD